MNEHQVPIAELVRRARAGDLDSWSSLVAEFQDVAAGLVAGWCGDWTIAEDVAQDAFVAAFLHLEDLRDPQAFPAWFKQIVHSAMTRHLRREVRVSSSPPWPNETGPDPIDAVATADDAQQLHHAIESLPEHERAVIALHYLADLPYPKVAELLGIGVSAAKKRGLSARRRLQELLPMAVDAFSSARPSRDTRLRDSVALFLAIRRRDRDLVGALLAQHPQLVEATEAWSREEAMELGLQNAEGGTPLVRAVQTGDLRLVELILAAGASPGLACGCAGAESALWAASLFGEAEIAARLLEDGADPNAAAFGGVTPLIVAAQRQHHDVTERLLAAGADPAITDAGGRTAQDWTALRRRSPERRVGAVLSTGVRALDLFAPIRPGSAQWWPAAWELGQFALLTEIVRSIEPVEFWQIGFATGPYDEESGRQWVRQFRVATKLRLTAPGTARERRAHFEATVRTVAASPAEKIVMILAGPDHRHDVTVAVAQFVDTPSVLTTIVVEPATGHATGAASERPEGFAAQVAFDPWRAARGLWPAVDAMRTTVATYPNARHEQLAASARAILEQYAAMDPHLEMQAPPTYADPALARCAQDLHRSLAQPFALWEHQTSLPGESTPYDELLDRVETLLAPDVYRN
jgi:RNA polymerase sigma factor (sigma-70 family)